MPGTAPAFASATAVAALGMAPALAAGATTMDAAFALAPSNELGQAATGGPGGWTPRASSLADRRVPAPLAHAFGATAAAAGGVNGDQMLAAGMHDPFGKQQRS